MFRYIRIMQHGFRNNMKDTAASLRRNVFVESIILLLQQQSRLRKCERKKTMGSPPSRRRYLYYIKTRMISYYIIFSADRILLNTRATSDFDSAYNRCANIPSPPSPPPPCRVVHNEWDVYLYIQISHYVFRRLT